MSVLSDASTMVSGADLVSAMALEERLLGDLRSALARQREGVSEDDPATLDAATLIVSRSVLTLEQARRRREQIMQLLTGGEPATYAVIEELTAEVPDLAHARTTLRNEAQMAVRELALNQAILARALKAGDAYLQTLFTSVTDGPGEYGQHSGVKERPTPSGVVLNTRA
ncbi:MAG: hypothetical protein ABIZ70_11410 [Gemmatimonadales bacterium]